MGDRDTDFQLQSKRWMMESVVTDTVAVLDGDSSYACSEPSRKMSEHHAVPLKESVLLKPV